MTKKHVAIEVMPRALWVVVGFTLFFAEKWSGHNFAVTSNVWLGTLGSNLLVVGLYFLYWTFRFLLKPMFTKELVTTGPYAFARHPMYVAIYLALIGLGFLIGSVVWFLVLVAFIPVWYLDCRLEEGQMTDLWGTQYLTYKKKVGMFFPHSF
ncbi:MAG: isoprenylcysteine carboxylmethyltransferase family protein [Candidatus Magasanikbacteria bacterium]|nr:isoprenylcysteine carboxylmethyltransferase family protein [Candidatus Magasanikbacteria bacterium]